MTTEDKDKFDEFLNEQFKLIAELYDKIRQNVVDYHRSRCLNGSQDCEDFFVGTIMGTFTEPPVAATPRSAYPPPMHGLN